MNCTYAQYCRLDLHVWDSDRTAIKKALLQIDQAYRFSFPFKPLRRRFLREVLKQHNKAQGLFYRVERGDLGTMGDTHDD